MRTIALWGILVLTVVLPPSTAGAQEVEVLIEKLVDKGILTPLEAQIIKDETKQAIATEVSKGSAYSLPAWVQNMKLTGDFRLRYQYERRNADNDARERGRIRYRLGLKSKVSGLEVGAGLASGGDDPRSTNQTFQDTFETGDIRLDYAYARYALNDHLEVIGGIFGRKDWLWQPTDLLWDGDINPAGGALHAEHSLTDNIEGFFNTGVWVLDEDGKSDGSSPFLYYTQAGAEWKDGDYDAKTAVTYYGFNGVKGTDLDWCAGTNTGVTAGSSGDCSGGRMYDYDSVQVSAEAGVKELFGGLPLGADERIAVFGDFVHNVDPDDNNKGWAIGGKFGNKKVSKEGTWQAKYIFANLEKDAFLDTFPDSDRYGGATDVRSHEAVVEYALKDNVIAGLDYYQSKRIMATKNTEHLLQADLVVKF